jgi:chorismate mutase
MLETMPTLESAVISANTQLWKPENYPFDQRRVMERLAASELLRIFGPCSLTSTEQLVDMLAIIADYVDLMRGNGKKPRTRPFSPLGKLLFEGIGMEAAAKIFAEVIQQYPQVLFAAEIMSGRDLKAIAQYLGLDWGGSRTQEQESLRSIGAGSAEAGLPLMIKNPLTNNPELMLGMMENAILGSNMTVPILLCLRGFDPTTNEEKKLWRNVPNLDLIPGIKKAFPDLPIIIDPSHMFLKQNLTPKSVAELVRQGKDLGANGYIIELHTPKHPSITDPGTDASETLEELDKRNLL